MKLPMNMIPALLLGFAMTAAAQPETVPAGTDVTVRTNDRIDIHDTSDGRAYSAQIAESVRDRNGRVVIPRGATAELVVRNVARRELALDLDSVMVGGKRYMVNAASESYAGSQKKGIGKNQRTAKYVGGGALLGTIIGAIAGGGKGAAIGAIAGGAAGAGGQVLTRGRDVRIPSESLLTFRLQQPLTVRGDYSRDRGYDRNGRRYHNEYVPDRYGR